MTLPEQSNCAGCTHDLRDLLAAVAFLYADRLPFSIYEELNDADDRLVATMIDLIKLRCSS